MPAVFKSYNDAEHKGGEWKIFEAHKRVTDMNAMFDISMAKN